MQHSIVDADAWLLVVEKPSGLLCQPGRGADKQDCLLARLNQQWPAARIVHRLDRDTSGLMLFALDADTHRQLSQQFAARQVEKQYEALVAGPVVASGQIDAPLRKDLDHPPRHMVDAALGKPAVTDWRVIERLPDRTRLQLTPQTGRSHQLRVHLAHIGCPILGDPLYAHAAAMQLSPRLALHATGLTFTHPASGQRLAFRSDCPF